MGLNMFLYLKNGFFSLLVNCVSEKFLFQCSICKWWRDKWSVLSSSLIIDTYPISLLFPPINLVNFGLIIVDITLLEFIIVIVTSVVGKIILHLNPDSFYDSHFASLSLNDLTSTLVGRLMSVIGGGSGCVRSRRGNVRLVIKACIKVQNDVASGAEDRVITEKREPTIQQHQGCAHYAQWDYHICPIRRPRIPRPSEPFHRLQFNQIHPPFSSLSPLRLYFAATSNPTLPPFIIIITV